MRILFLHQNFPGQFGRLARSLATRPGYDVRALAIQKRPAPEGVRVNHYQVPPPPPGTASQHPGVQEIESKILRGDACTRACQVLRDGGFVPDLIIGHPGWGEMLRLPTVFPEAKVISYAEFYFQDHGSDHDFDPEFTLNWRETALRRTLKNAVLDVGVRLADAAVAPTFWQASRFPDPLRAKIEVIHDGIDTQEVKPAEDAWVQVGQRRLTRADPVVTFTTRYLEPLRGIHSFLRALPRVMAQNPRAIVVVVGREDGGYWNVPKDKSHRRRYMEEVGERLDLSRLHFVTWAQRKDYLRLLQISSAHVYLTYPFVLSWSMLEAMASGCCVIGSNTPPVTEVIEDGLNGRLVEFSDPQALADRILESLDDEPLRRRLGRAARETVLRRYDLETHCLPRWHALIDRVMGA